MSDLFQSYALKLTGAGLYGETKVGAIQATTGSADAGKFVLTDASGKVDSSLISGGGGSNVYVNGTAISSPNFGNLPAAPGATTLVTWQYSGSPPNVSAYVQLPQTFTPTLAGSPPEYEYLTGYDAITGLFSAAAVPVTSQVNADWNAVSGVAEILNKPTLATVATSGSYTDLSNKPTLPVTDAGSLHHFLTSYTSGTGAFTDAQPDYTDITGLSTVAHTGAYGDLSGLPQLAQTFAPILSPPSATEFLTGYNATTGLFSGQVVAYADISGTVPNSQLTGSGQITVSGTANHISVSGSPVALGGTVTLDLASPLSLPNLGAAILFQTDNTNDIGASGATRPRTVYAGTSVLAPLFNAATGFQIGGAAATVGHVLRANGTDYVDAQLAYTDLSGLPQLPVTFTPTLAGSPPVYEVLTGYNAATGLFSATTQAGGGSSTLASDTDVLITTPANHDLLQYNSTDGKWENVSSIAANTTGTAANLSGTPTLPNGTQAATQSPGDATNDIATDAFVAAALGSYVPPVPSSLFTRTYYSSATRALGTMYQNTTGQPIIVMAPITQNTGAVALVGSVSMTAVIVTSVTVNSATSATVAVGATAGFANGDTVWIGGLNATGNTQLNGGPWTVASSVLNTSITITGSGWSTHGAAADSYYGFIVDLGASGIGVGSHTPIVSHHCVLSTYTNFLFVVPNNYWYAIVAPSSTWDNWVEYEIKSGSVTFSGDRGPLGTNDRFFGVPYHNTSATAKLIVVENFIGQGTANLVGYSDPSPSPSSVNFAITSCTTNSATSATLAVSTTSIFTVGAMVFVSELTAANNTQLNGVWYIASISAGVSITITGSGWTAHGATGDSGTITQSQVVWAGNINNGGFVAYKMMWIVVPAGHYYSVNGQTVGTLTYWNEYTLPFNAARSSDYALNYLTRTIGYNAGGIPYVISAGTATYTYNSTYPNFNGKDLFVSAGFQYTSAETYHFLTGASAILGSGNHMVTIDSHASNYQAMGAMLMLPNEFYGITCSAEIVPTETHWWEYVLG